MTSQQPKLANIFLGHWRTAARFAVLYLVVLVVGVLGLTRYFSGQLTQLLLGYQLQAISTQTMAQLRADREVDFEHLQFLLQKLPQEGLGFWPLSGERWRKQLSTEIDLQDEREIVLESLMLDTPKEIVDLSASLTRLHDLLWSLRIANPALQELEFVYPLKNEVLVLTGDDHPGFPGTSRSPLLAAIGRSASFVPKEAYRSIWPDYRQEFREKSRLQVPIRTEDGIVGCLRITLSEADATAVAESQSRLLAIVGLFTGLLLGGISLSLASRIRATSTQSVARPLAELSELLQDVDKDQDGHISVDEITEISPRIEAFHTQLHAAREIHDITAAAHLHLSLLKDTLEENEEIQAQLRDALSRLEEASTMLVQSSKGWMLAELGAWIAHDLNNKLQGAYSISSNWLDREKPCPVKHLKFLHTSIEKALEQVDQFNKLSRPQSSERVELITAEELLEDLKLLVSQRVQQAGVELKVDVEKGLAYRNIAPGKFQDLLMNLVFNGCDAITEKGEPNGVIDIKVEKNQFVVTDNGIGIPQEEQGALFSRPFFTTKGEGGSGLGLRIVASVASEFLGTVECSSTPGNGATFTVSIGQDHIARADE